MRNPDASCVCACACFVVVCLFVFVFVAWLFCLLCLVGWFFACCWN